VADYIRLGGPDEPAGLFAAPVDGGGTPGIIITSAIAGLNDYVSRLADRFAALGYQALGLDYYSRTSGSPDLSSPEKVMAAVAGLSDPAVLADMQTAADWLRGRPGSSGRVACVGFCIGGSYALLASAQIPGLACAVSFYGMLHYPSLTGHKPEHPVDAATRGKCPILGHFGENDHLIPVADVLALREATRAQAAEIYTYPGAGHAFHEDFRPQVHRPVAATAAWDRTVTFLQYYLTSAYVTAA
jgi:carboxymethylenebutenolidase